MQVIAIFFIKKYKNIFLGIQESRSVLQGNCVNNLKNLCYL